MSLPPVFIVTGPPGAGKTTLSRALMERFEFGIHIPVDDLRELVAGGFAGPIGWNEETTRQFRLAEHAACDLALRYGDAGFAAAIDHCTHLVHLDELVSQRLQSRPVVKVLLLPDLEENQRRNSERTSKTFDYTALVATIDDLNALYRTEDASDWIRLDNTRMTVPECVDFLLADL